MTFSLRWAASNEKYIRAGKRGLFRELWQMPPIKEFKYFTIISNDFPHDRIADVHHMLIPKRIVNSWKKLHWYELREFRKMDEYLSAHYDGIALNLPSINSITNIVHWHLYRYKK